MACAPKTEDTSQMRLACMLYSLYFVTKYTQIDKIISSNGHNVISCVLILISFQLFCSADGKANLLSTMLRICPKYKKIQTGMYTPASRYYG